MRRAMRRDPLSPWRTIKENQPFTAQEVTDLVLPVHLALEAFRTGAAKQTDMDTLAIVANTCLIRAEQIASDLVDAVKDAQESLMQVQLRHKRTGRYGMTSEEMTEAACVIDLYEQLLNLSTPRQMRLAIEECLRRSRAGLVYDLESA